MRMRCALGTFLAGCVLTVSAFAQAPGNCEAGEASADLDVNNVRARLYNTGGLFWRGSGNVYTVPKDGHAQAIFASGIWIGGLANGDDLRFAGTTYGPWEFWPGPLDESGNAPADCAQYDHIHSVYREDVERFLENGGAAPSVENWPGDLGAPYVDVNDDGRYNPGDGDYPDIVGDQTVWWVMNDVGGPKEWADTAPIGLEVQVTAFAFKSADALNDATFYRYKLIHKGNEPLVDTHLGLNVDPDVGNASDDLVGSDTTLGLGFTYNGDDFDQGADGYGDRPAAIGYDFLQGPLVRAPGERWIDPDGSVHVDSTRLEMSHFVYYVGDSGPRGDPGGDTAYLYLQGVWRDGTPLTFGGTGYGGSEPADFMFPGDPVTREYWSEENVDGEGTQNQPGDRRFLMSTGPFTLRPGDVQEIVFGIVWARSPDRLASVAQLRMADQRVQSLFDANFRRTPLPDAPIVMAEPMAGSVALWWSNPEASNNYLNTYDEESSYLTKRRATYEDSTYSFEGYKVYRYDSPDDVVGELIATFDVENNVAQIGDEVIDPVSGYPEYRLVANGSNSGIQQYLTVNDLTDYSDYTFGVQAYAYNAHSMPHVLESPVTKITVQPMPSDHRGIGYRAIPGDQIPSRPVTGVATTSSIFAKVVDPGDITGHRYELHFLEIPERFDSSETVLTYDVVDATAGDVLVDGRSFFERTDRSVGIGSDVVVVDGLSLTVETADPEFARIAEVATPDGPIEPDNVWHALNSTNDYYVSATESGHIQRLERYITHAVPRDFEIRFTEEGGYGVYAFSDDKISRVPFEVWDAGAATPDDPSDDVRMIPFILESGEASHAVWGDTTGTEPYFGYPTWDAVYFIDPISPDGYALFEQAALQAGGAGATYPYDSDSPHCGYFAEQCFLYPVGRVLIGDYEETGTPPPTGTIIRFETTKPVREGVVLAIDTEAYAPVQTTETMREAIQNVGIVPNPYRGASDYEVSAKSDEVRFTQLPGEAVVRVFTLSGDLVREMRMSSFDNSWDLTNDNGLSIASGVYLVHVEVPDVGEKVIKFGAVMGRAPMGAE